MRKVIPGVITAGCLMWAAVVQWKRLELHPWQQAMLAQLALIVAVLALTGAAGVAYLVAAVRETWEAWRDAD